MKLVQLAALSLLRLSIRIWRKANRGDEHNPRHWSNRELRKLSSFFHGDIINISAGLDKDKEGGYYHDYFPNARTYSVTNYVMEELDDSSVLQSNLDLTKPLPEKFKQSYDVVLNHTVLEHVDDPSVAVRNLCQCSRDLVVTVIPFLQTFHHIENQYYDYWRISPYALAVLFSNAGFETIYVSWNTSPVGDIYILHIASRNPQKWESIVRLNDPKRQALGPGYHHKQLEQGGEPVRSMIKRTPALLSQQVHQWIPHK